MGDALRLAQGEAAPLLVVLRCGGCGAAFTANAKTVPVLGSPSQAGGGPCCQPCWDALNGLRVRANLAPWARPACYPSDYPHLPAPAAPVERPRVRRVTLGI